MNLKLKSFLISAIASCALFSSSSFASHVTKFAPIDSIDHIFGIGGGSFAVTTSGGSDDGWIRFAANSGDVLSISAAGIFGPNVVLFLAGINGIVEVGDKYTTTGNFNGNSLQTGTGIDLIVQAMAFHGCGDCYVSPGSASFTVSTSGEYAIGISAANEDSSFSGTTTISLSGNTRDVASAVPEPASVALLALGLAGLGFCRRKQA